MKLILPLVLVSSAALAAVRGTSWDVLPSSPATGAVTSVAEAPRPSAGEAYDDEAYDDEAYDDEAYDDEAFEQTGECPWVGANQTAEVPVDGEPSALDDSDDADPHAGVRLASAGVAPPAAPLRRSEAKNGTSISELYAARSQLAQHLVRVRGVVVKRTDGILDQTYLHLRDGSGSAEHGDQDLTVTTTQEFELGEEIEVEGRVLVDRDLGLGYRYPVLLEASVRVGERR